MKNPNSQTSEILNKYSLLPGGYLAALSTQNGVRLAELKGHKPKQFKKLSALTMSQQRRAEKILGLEAIYW